MSFDKVKEELLRLESPVPITVISGIVSIVPYFGGLLDIGVNSTFNHFQEKKKKRFFRYHLNR